MSSGTWKKFLIIPALAIGVLILMMSVKSKQAPQKTGLKERPRSVRGMPAPEVALVPRAIGYGYVQPGQVWQAVSEVQGRVVELHPELKKGSVVKKGEIMLRIDPETYGLAESRSKADVANLEAQLRELKQTEDNYKQTLEVEKASLRLGLNDLERIRRLYANRTVSRSELDKTEQSYLAQKTKVQSLENSLNLIPAKRQSLLAMIEKSKTSVEDTRLNLGKTEIRAPFDCRVAAVNVEIDQFAPAGKVLVEADDISVAEIIAQLPTRDFFMLAPHNEESPIIAEGNVMDNVRQALGIGALVRLQITPEHTVEWKARFSRTTPGIDTQTRTIGVVVEVDEPYRQVKFGVRPPLIKNMYCEVELRGKPKPKAVVLPRSAIHEDIVYIVNNQNRLERRRIKVAYEFGNVVMVEDGVKPDETVVLTDVIPAIDGMLLDPVVDDKALKALVAEATGEAPIQ